MKPRILASIIVVAIIALGGILFAVTGDSENEPAPTSTNTGTEDTDGDEGIVNTVVTNTEGETLYTNEEVAEHDSEDDCWTVIDGVVYDITSYIPNHPGEDEILRACGADGSTLFNERETSNGEQVGSGLPHSSTAASQLAEMQVGLLGTADLQ